ncbi:MAG TPA: prolipoprotein diacylglyceryl transferase [Gemmatimonadaceae bacterium]|jgi:phosphatidylglycerol:prolipoprotein diacylglycerol transferase|nr:prolipoprotein diacylglyceryl transferase [Gemmatimonadaceae bacterium]
MKMIFASIVHHPLSYDVGPLQLTGFGLAVLMAFVIAQIITQRELARRGRDPEPVGDLVFAAVIGGLLGGKIYYAILMHDASALFSRAGFVFWGGLLGGILACYLVIRYKHLSFTRVSDVAGIAIAAAYSIGRTGCWAVGDDYGRPFTGFGAVSFPNGAPPSTVANMTELFHIPAPALASPNQVLSVYPTQLYEVALGFVMFLILWRLRNHKHAEGWLFGVYCLLAGIERFFMEFLRAKDDRFVFGTFTTAQVIALLFAIGGAIWMYMRRNPGPDAPGIYAAPLPA